MAAKLASAKETIARLMRGVISAPAPIEYKRGSVEPMSEREFTKGMLLSGVRYSGRRDFVGLSLVSTTDNKFITRSVKVEERDGTRVVLFSSHYVHEGITTRVLVLGNGEKVCSLSSTIHNFLKDGIKCARLRKLHVYSSLLRSPAAGRGSPAQGQAMKSSSRSSSISLSTSRQKNRPTAGKAATPPIVWTKRVTLPSAAGPSVPNELPSRSRSMGTLHLPSAMNSL